MSTAGCLRPRPPRAALRAAALSLLATLAALPACDAGVTDLAMGAGDPDLGTLIAPLTSGVCADGSTTFGIDVSKWQGTINWASVKAAGVKFAIIRVSDGTGYLDGKFAANWAGAKAQGILRGAYQFFRSNQDPTAQANVLLDALATHGAGELPAVIDVETTDGQSAATIASRVGTWLTRVTQQTGKKPIIYTGGYFWESNVQTSAYAGYPLWIAHWTSGCPSIPSVWSDWKFHQYSATGSVSGISGDVDLNKFNGSLAQLQAFAGVTVTPAAPKVSIRVVTQPVSGQAADFRPEGSSEGVFDLYEGQTFTTDVLVKNDGAAAVATAVHVGVLFEGPWLTPLSYAIHTDYPKKDQATWVLNDADSNPANPSHASPPASGKYQLYAMSPGETKRIRFTVRASQYSLGAVDHPDVRAWVWHVANWYGEQTAWDDAVETNGAGAVLRSYWQHDVFARDRWTFEGPNGADTEGWRAGNALSAVSVNTIDNALALKLDGSDPYVLGGPAQIDAGQRRGLRIVARTYDGDRLSRLYFTTAADGQWSEAKALSFVTPGDGAFHTLTLDLAALPTWTGTITGLRLDPAPSGAGVWYDVGEVVSVASVPGTSGDADGDGALAAPGPDCDDSDAGVGPGQTERCDGRDEDCDGVVDGGFDVGGACSAGVGACAASGVSVCAAGGLGVACSAVAGTPRSEVCNGVDDDCDGTVDEGACSGTCLPGASGPCPLAGAPAGCEIGVRRCGAGGAWGECELVPGCGDPVVVEEEADAGCVAEDDPADGGAGDAGCAEEVAGADTGVAGILPEPGCAGGAAGGGLAALGWALAGLLAAARRVRRGRRAGSRP